MSMKNWSIKAKILAGFMIPAGLVAIVGLIGLFGGFRLSGNITAIADNTVPAVFALWKVNEAQSAADAAFLAQLIPTLKPEQKQAEIQKLQDALARIKEGFKEYEVAPRSEEEDKVYKALIPVWNKWETSMANLIKLGEEFTDYKLISPNKTQRDLLKQGKEDSPEYRIAEEASEAQRKMYEYASDVERPAFQEATDALVNLLEYNNKLVATANKDAKRDVSVATFLSIVGMLAGTGAAIVFGLALSKDIKQIISQVQKSGIQVTTSTTQIAASGKELEATVAEQVASTKIVSSTAQEIATTSRKLVKTMDQVASMAQSTAQSAGSSQKDLSQMENVMRHLAHATTAITDKLGVMNEKANNINNVVTTITKVADQTNLLSLNAAIEAEKAGEYGAGFAVVAREIRRLADQTAVATLEIEQMVKEMQTSVSTGVMEMDKFSKSVSDSVEKVVYIGEQLAQVINQVQGLTPRFEEVSQSMEEQSEGAQQISESMEQLIQASTQTSDALRETNSALNQLDDAAQGLRIQVAILSGSAG